MMKKLAIILMVVCGTAFNTMAQDVTPLKCYPTVSLGGPRVGFTWIGYGQTRNDLKNNYNMNPFISQFGWQAEWRYFSLPTGAQGVIEFVPLIGGLDQSKFLPSGNLVIGVRSRRGAEFGVGPNLSVAGFGFVIAGGVTLKADDVFFPINLGLVTSSGGVRLGLLVGFNAKKTCSTAPRQGS